MLNTRLRNNTMLTITCLLSPTLWFATAANYYYIFAVSFPFWILWFLGVLIQRYWHTSGITVDLTTYKCERPCLCAVPQEQIQRGRGVSESRNSKYIIENNVLKITWIVMNIDHVSNDKDTESKMSTHTQWCAQTWMLTCECMQAHTHMLARAII